MWDKVDVNQAKGTAWVSLGVHGRVANGGYQQIKLILSAVVVQFLRVLQGDQVHIERGTNEHLGWLRITKRKQAEDPGFTLSLASKRSSLDNLAVRVSSAFLYITTPHATERCPDVVPSAPGERRYVCVELPEWAICEPGPNPWDPEKREEDKCST